MGFFRRRYCPEVRRCSSWARIRSSPAIMSPSTRYPSLLRKMPEVVNPRSISSPFPRLRLAHTWHGRSEPLSCLFSAGEEVCDASESTLLEWVDEVDSTRLEVTRVACGELHAVTPSDGSDLAVSEAHGSPDFPAMAHDLTIVMGCR